MPSVNVLNILYFKEHAWDQRTVNLKIRMKHKGYSCPKLSMHALLSRHIHTTYAHRYWAIRIISWSHGACSARGRRALKLTQQRVCSRSPRVVARGLSFALYVPSGNISRKLSQVVTYLVSSLLEYSAFCEVNFSKPKYCALVLRTIHQQHAE